MDAQEFIRRFKDGSISEEDFSSLIESIIKRAVEESLRILPSVIDHLTQQVRMLQAMSEEFYKEHPGLCAHKELVAKVIEQIEAENPGLSYKDVLAKAALVASNRISQMPTLSSNSKMPNVKKLDSALGDL
jgi:hypothetical protein